MIVLPANYDLLSPSMRKEVRETYIKLQKGLCCHCGAALDGPAAKKVLRLSINKKLFPSTFLGGRYTCTIIIKLA